MTAKVIAITNQKGGCGKTTTCINLGAQLAAMGYKTLIVDVDHQADSTKVLSGNSYEFDVTVADLFSNQKVNAQKAIKPAMADETIIDNLFFLPSHITLSRVIEQSLTRVHRERILQRHLKNLSGDFDYVLIDCPPSLSLGVTNAMMVADLFLIPVDGGRFALDGLSDLLDAIEEVKETSAFQFAVFRNEYAGQNKLMNEFLDEQLESIKDHVLKTVVRRAEAVGQASVTAQPLLCYAPSSSVARDYQELADEIIKRLT